MSSNGSVVVCGGFDDLRARHLRFLEEASRRGPLTVLLWPDELYHQRTGKLPQFPLAERSYLLKAVRFVSSVVPLASSADVDALPSLDEPPQIWVDWEAEANAARRSYCRQNGIDYQVLSADQLAGFPGATDVGVTPGRKKVIVTGCYDWFHSGHVRFFEEVSAYGDLYAIVGHDANIRLLKGAGHPLVPEEERRYMVGSVRFVHLALVSSGNGWLDAEPEIEKIRPDIYAVNEDGDRGGKREFCERHGIEYLVLKRTPAPGLPARSSTHLRGF